jgi:hypothetical protein
VDTRYKHILIITDAGVEESNYESMVRMITKDGVNVSTVLVGAQAHNQFLIDVASWGKGRFYSAVDRYSLPELILKQPSTMKLPAYKTGTFTVRSRGGEGWWSDVNRRAMPALDGYVETSTRPGAEVLMEVDGNEHPLLATWRYGLGSVTALMTEPVGEGTRRWGDWRDYGRLLARIFTRTADDARLFRYDVSRTDHVVTVTARRYSRDSTLYPQAVVLDEQERETGTLRFRQLAPEHFSARLTVDPSADVRLSAAAYSGPASRGQQPTRLISTASDDAAPEQQVDPEQGLDLEALATATGGRYTDADAVAAGRLDVAAPASASSSPPALGSLSVIRLWPLLLMLGLLLYLAELVYRRSTWPATRRAARTVSA